MKINKIILAFFLLTVVVSSFSFPPVAHGAVPTDYVSCWDMEESSATRIDANTTNSNDLTDVNTVVSGTGIINNGGDFESSNSEYIYIDDATASGLDGMSDVSISAWFKAESSGAFKTVVNKRGSGASQGGYMIRIASDNSTIYAEVGDGTNTTGGNISSSAVTTGVWYHIVITLDNADGDIIPYINNTVKTTITGTASGVAGGNSQPFMIGASNNTSSGSGRTPIWYMDGVVDIVEVYNRVLTSTEVSDLYNAGAGVGCSGRGGGGGTVIRQTEFFFE